MIVALDHGQEQTLGVNSCGRNHELTKWHDKTQTLLKY